MNLALPEHPINSTLSATVRCADLPSALAGASPEAVEQVVVSLSAQLKQLGWQEVSSTPGLRMYSKRGRMLALDQLVGMLAGGYISANKWSATCATDGISDLMVPAPQSALADSPVMMPVGGFRDPFEVVSASGPPDGSTPPVGRRFLRAASVAGLVLIVVFSGYLRFQRAGEANDHLAGHVKAPNEFEVDYDGRLAANGGRVTSVYVKQDHEFETVDPPAPDEDFPDIKTIETNGVSRYGGGGRNHVTVSHAKQRESLNDPAIFEQWINARNVIASNSGTTLVSAKSTSLDGRPAWEWEWSNKAGHWNYAIRAPMGKDVYSVRCRSMASESTASFRARCEQVAASMKIPGGRS